MPLFRGLHAAAPCRAGAPGGWSTYWIHDSACCRQGGNAEPYPASDTGDVAHATGPDRSFLRHCFESAADCGRSVRGRFNAICRTAGGEMPRLTVIALLRFYKTAISPWLPSACRFHPTCSEYMMQAVERYGASRGIWLGLKRLARCQPFCAGGYDPVR